MDRNYREQVLDEWYQKNSRCECSNLTHLYSLLDEEKLTQEDLEKSAISESTFLSERETHYLDRSVSSLIEVIKLLDKNGLKAFLRKIDNRLESTPISLNETIDFLPDEDYFLTINCVDCGTQVLVVEDSLLRG